jgi:cytoplasmic iron level regulating protein YaaA (DUF328/UPF0246 family)
VLIIVPPSESKRPAPQAGSVVDIDALSFPELNPLRRQILSALIETSERPDALNRLGVGPSLMAEVARNTDIRDLATQPALQVYSGPLHAGLDAATLPAAAAKRAARQLVVVSALWGALRPTDRIPPYRLFICARLVDLDRLEPRWRTILPRVLADAAGSRGVIVDLRSPSYRAMGKPARLEERTVILHVRQRAAGGRFVGDAVAKRMRGEAARHLLESGADPADPVQVASLLGERWSLELHEPGRPDRPWEISLLVS